MVVRHSPGSRRLTLGADKAYDVHGFVEDLRDLNVTPHIAQNTTNRSSAIDVARHAIPVMRSFVTGLSAPPRARPDFPRYWRSSSDFGRRLGGNFHA
jgi:hypothetical protein